MLPLIPPPAAAAAAAAAASAAASAAVVAPPAPAAQPPPSAEPFIGPLPPPLVAIGPAPPVAPAEQSAVVPAAASSALTKTRARRMAPVHAEVSSVLDSELLVVATDLVPSGEVVHDQVQLQALWREQYAANPELFVKEREQRCIYTDNVAATSNK